MVQMVEKLEREIENTGKEKSYKNGLGILIDTDRFINSNLKQISIGTNILFKY